MTCWWIVFDNQGDVYHIIIIIVIYDEGYDRIFIPQNTIKQLHSRNRINTPHRHFTTCLLSDLTKLLLEIKNLQQKIDFFIKYML